MKKKTIHIIVSVLSWAFTAFCLLALIFAAYTFLRSKQTGERPDIFGYRAVYVLTGSMEPSMKTDSIVITKAVSSLDELKAGDIITYHTSDTEGRTLTITHRIKSIQADGTIHTKGDNNRVEDAMPVTIENVESKVVLICNFVASLVHTWAKPVGKVLLISAISAVICFLIFIDINFSRCSADTQDIE